MICSCMNTYEFYVARYSKDKIEFLTLIYWAGTIEAPSSFLFIIIWSFHNNISIFSFPTVRLCLGFTLIYATMLTVSNIFLVSSLRIFKQSGIFNDITLKELQLFLQEMLLARDACI